MPGCEPRKNKWHEPVREHAGVVRKLEACCALRKQRSWENVTSQELDRVTSNQGPAQGPHRPAPGNATSCSFTPWLFPIILFSEALKFSGSQHKSSLTLRSQRLDSKRTDVLTWPSVNVLTCSSQGHFLLVWFQPPSPLKMKPRLYFLYSNRLKNIFQVVISTTVLILTYDLSG